MTSEVPTGYEFQIVDRIKTNPLLPSLIHLLCLAIIVKTFSDHHKFHIKNQKPQLNLMAIEMWMRDAFSKKLTLNSNPHLANSKSNTDKTQVSLPTLNLVNFLESSVNCSLIILIRFAPLLCHGGDKKFLKFIDKFFLSAFPA